jgi:hypothetical protein
VQGKQLIKLYVRTTFFNIILYVISIIDIHVLRIIYYYVYMYIYTSILYSGENYRSSHLVLAGRVSVLQTRGTPFRQDPSIGEKEGERERKREKVSQRFSLF